MSGKKILLPRELVEWPHERSETNWEGMALGAGGMTMRDLFEDLCMTLGVTWHYDIMQDVIHAEPKWRRSDSRSGKELINTLFNAKPVRWTDLPDGARNRVGGINRALDGWRVTFDALLSRPENFPTAGTLRLYHDAHGHINVCPFPVNNLFTGRMLDAGGRQQVIVVNGQEMFTNKEDPGDVAYYLFDEDGKFVSGGVYSITEGWVGNIIKAELAGDHVLALAVTGNHGEDPVRLHFRLADGGLILDGSIDSKGIQRNAEDTQMVYPAFRGKMTQLKYRLPAKDGI